MSCDLISGRTMDECLSGRAGIKSLYFTKFNDFAALTGITESGGEITSLGAVPIILYRFDVGNNVGNFDETVNSNKDNGTEFVLQTITLSLFNVKPADLENLNALKRGRWAIWSMDFENKIRLFGRVVGCVASGGSDVSGVVAGDKKGVDIVLTASENDYAPFMADFANEPFDNFGNVSIDPAGSGTTWYVRPSGGSYGAEDGTTYASAWDGFTNIVWGGLGIQPGDTLYIAGTHTETLIVGSSGLSGSPITIRGDYGGDAGVIDSEDTRTQGVSVINRNYITITSLSSIDATVDCFEFRGTGTGHITNNIVASGSGNQGIQHENTVSVTHNNPTCDDNVDDGISGHDSVTIVIVGGSFTNNAEGLNVVESATMLVTAAPTFSGNSAFDVYATAADGNESCWIDITGSTFPQVIRASSGGKLVLRSCTANSDIICAVGGAATGYIDAYNTTFAGDIDVEEGGEFMADNCNITGAYTSDNLMTSVDLTDCTVTPAVIMKGAFTATRTVFLGQLDMSIGYTATLDSCLITSLDTSSIYGDWVLTNCRVIGQTVVGGTFTAQWCLFDGGGAGEHILDTISGSTLDLSYCVFKGMAAGKYGVAGRTGATVTIDGCTFFGTSNVGSGLFTQVDGTFGNNIFTELDKGVNLSGVPTVVLNNNCYYDNTTDISGVPTDNNPQTTDPALTNPATLDFSLGGGSSCIGNGLDLGASIDDGIDTANWGNGTTTVPAVTQKQQAASWDIGAYVS